MSSDSTRNKKWEIGSTSQSFQKHFFSHPEHTKHINEFENDVTENPFRHKIRRRIVPIAGDYKRYPEGCYRWRKTQLRIVYFPNKVNQTVYPLDADTAGNIRYKKKN